MPRVSVILASYGHERFVGRAIESALAQTFADFELLVVDDGSPDRSVEVISGYQDPRLRFFPLTVNRAVHPRNFALERARGEYVAILNSDDEFEPEKLALQVAFLDEHPQHVAVFSRARLIDEEGNDHADSSHPFRRLFDAANRSRTQWLRHFFLEGNALCHPTVLMRLDAVRAAGRYEPRLLLMSDLDLWVRLCLRGEIEILEAPLTRMRILNDDRNLSAPTARTAQRDFYEHVKTLGRYTTPDALRDLPLIFPELASAPHASMAERLLELALLASRADRPSTRFFGYELLYTLAADERAAGRPLLPELARLTPFGEPAGTTLQIFWSRGQPFDYCEEFSTTAPLKLGASATFRVPVPLDARGTIRVDPGAQPGVISVSAVRLVTAAGEVLWSARSATDLVCRQDARSLGPTWPAVLISTGADPSVLLEHEPSLLERGGLSLELSLRFDGGAGELFRR